MLKWRKLSFIAERLLATADLACLTNFFRQISEDRDLLAELANGEHSYFVIRCALKRFVTLSAENSQSPKVKKCAKSLKVLTEIYVGDIIRKLRNKYSSLLFRNLIQTHCGIIYDDEKPIGSDGKPPIETQISNIPKEPFLKIKPVNVTY